MDPMSMYSQMMYSQAMPTYDNLKSSKNSYTDATMSASKGNNFNDYDDESGNYYIGKSSTKQRQLLTASDLTDEFNHLQKRTDKLLLGGSSADETMLIPDDGDEEQVDHEEQPQFARRRAKRQVYYQSGYDGEQQCYGFPLEINVRSRIKMDQIFPIHGRSQFKKCIKVG